MSRFICGDTEDNSRELLAAGRSGFDKQMVQIAAKAENGEKFYWSLKKGVEPSSPDGFKLESAAREQFLNYLKRREEKFFYFHNVQYDLGNLFGRNLDELDCTLVGGRMIKAKWGSKLFADSFNIWPMSVAKLAPAFGLEKMEFDSTSRDYVFRDVEVIWRAMKFAWSLATEHIGLKALPATLGGLCVKTWQVWDGANCHDSFEMCRRALYGGRVELFKHNNDCNAVAWTDINSLYPFVMCREFPGPLTDYGKKLAPHGVAEVTIKVPKCEIAPLPFRADDGRILYPYGTFKGVWTMPELNNAVEQGGKILKVHGCYGTDETMQPYKDFVDKLYAARLVAETEAEKLFFKLLMNNLYGRLGTSGKISRTVWQTEKNRFEGVPYGEKVLVNYQMPLSEETNWCHAAYVTAYGRLELQKYLRKIGPEKMIYCDTDSCFFDVPDVLRCGDLGHLALPPWYFRTGRELGEMKLERWTDTVETFAPKTYRAGRIFKAKGVPKHLAKQFQEKGQVHFDLPFKFREAVAYYDGVDRQGRRRHDMAGNVVSANSKRLSVWRTVEKVRRTGYDRKTLKGNNYFPCRINRQ